MVKSTSTADIRFRVRHLALGLALVFLVPVLLCALTSCSLGSMPTKSSSVSGDSVSDGLASESSSPADSDLSGDDGEDPADPSDPSSIMRNIAEGYMTVLQEGNIDATAELFKMREAELLPTTYECDETIYHALWANMTYLYGAVSTSDYVDYKLDVTCEIPDFRGCVNMIIEDETAMSYLTQDWILAMGDPQAEVEAYAKMWNSILLAAAETIEQGVYTDKVMYTDSFSFHDNKDGNWICMSYVKKA